MVTRTELLDEFVIFVGERHSPSGGRLPADLYIAAKSLAAVYCC